MSEQNEEEFEEYQILEMESDDGQVVEFLVLDTLHLEGEEYVMLINHERFLELNQLDEAAWDQQADEFEGILVLRQVGEEYSELSEEEIERIQPHIDALFEEE